jgi:hypothetical protein
VSEEGVREIELAQASMMGLADLIERAGPGGPAEAERP